MATFVWPVFFATKSLNGAKVTIKKGQPFPLQDRFFIKGLARAYGVANPDTIPFNELPYVAVVNVANEGNARNIIERGLSLDEAKKLVEREATS